MKVSEKRRKNKFDSLVNVLMKKNRKESGE